VAAPGRLDHERRVVALVGADPVGLRTAVPR
jgi:hypothetical protein